MFKGTTDSEQVEAWTLNMLKSFKTMEVLEEHWMRLTSCIFEEASTFWWEFALVTNSWEANSTLLLSLNFYWCSMSNTIQNSLGCKELGSSLA